MNKTILVVDDDKGVRMSASFVLSREGYCITEADSPVEALNMLGQNQIDLVLLDMNYSQDTTSGREGLEFLQTMNRQHADIPVVIMTAWPSVDVAVEAMKIGAKDFVEKPWKNPRLLQVVKQQLQVGSLLKENKKLQQQNRVLQGTDILICESDVMKQVFTKINRVAMTDASVLLTGENGTGKSSIAKYIHSHSPRREQGLITVNMGAIPESLFESELFGHEKGAFTDSKNERVGRFELADKGTLFLDEVSEMPVEQQAKVLRVLEGGEFERVGSSVTQCADVRLISASNQDFAELIQQKRFRQDLYYRLNTVVIRIPALRERGEDIIPLAEYFIQKHSQRYGRKDIVLTQEATLKLREYSWPGNVRELSHVIERAILFCEESKVSADHILIDTISEPAQLEVQPLDEVERRLVKQAMIKAGGNTAEAASLLDISTSAMYRRLEKYNIKAK
ncbi:sigma-54-dependent Fis family transcriptional regulator [Pseudoalteromonas luteoviolacea]|uniref:Sigma-54-dependent Fis family transcriptional regulator n=1 Tax=Pseudoalteromonas luteoviolacea TaxID=43657 RepID=A0A1C0TJX3_9GAMM|nr:sigma-54 dependent transcriptional regulator [Pseudoalteromonas luteoviolacea]OCQ18701.1 sigma-54-dependent Fis family transcriptional regulator [Pseudoalteromonas luteoviolacea]